MEFNSAFNGLNLHHNGDPLGLVVTTVAAIQLQGEVVLQTAGRNGSHFTASTDIKT